MRVFAGLPLPGAVREPMGDFMAALRQVDRGLKCVNPAGLHITIHFFGELGRPEVERVCRVMDQPALGRLPAIPSGLETAGQFPPRGNPRVIFLDLMQGAQQIAACRELFTGLLAEAGFRLEPGKPFVPHLTVARNKGASLAPGYLDGLPVPRLDFVFDRLVLYQSRLTPRGAEYTALKTVNFS